jgi:hypothetical protein
MNTGEVLTTQHNAMTLLPPSPDVCQECATDHAWDQPHNQQSLYYKMRFHGTHGRYPTWSDAMAHCTEEVKASWRAELVRMMQEHGMEIPEDLRQEKPSGR